MPALTLLVLAALGAPPVPRCPAPCIAAVHRSPVMPTRATGTFEVKLVPQPADAYGDARTMGRQTIDKSFSGDLAGTSVGQMLYAMGSEQGSAGYVAIERVTGTLHGKRGTFMLQHLGTMTRGAQALTVAVVPDSGTDELTGLSGTMQIIVSPGRHEYVFEYELPSRP